MTSGIISALNREIDSPNGFKISGAVQTDAARSTPATRAARCSTPTGALIGVNSQIATNGSDANSGVGFALPIDTVKQVACITTLSGASAAVHAIAHARTEIAKSLQERIDEARSACVLRTQEFGPYSLVSVERGALDAGNPGQFFMLEAPGRVLPRPMSSAWRRGTSSRS